jgi:hypothetical protein
VLKFDIKVHKSVGKIRFGMNRNDVHVLLKKDPKEFKKTKSSKNTTDDYGAFHIYYTADDKVEAVEFFDETTLTLNGKTIFPISENEIKSILPDANKKGNSYIDKEKSIAIEFDGSKAKSILVGSAGYFN